MKRVKINTNIPAYLYDFSNEPNEKFTRAKLKVFYIGETPDKRLFTKSFAEKVIKTLPYTPVVSHYDEEKDDFVGHAADQNIYGIVDPCRKVNFEEDGGKTWAICDVVLYTERKDSVGKISSKIVDKQQSLELDPTTIQYSVNYDKNRKFKNIEFTDGQFIGVSVLGDDQQPAFTGSGFFELNQEFESKMEILKDYCLEKSKRGSDMDATILNFMELSWGEKSKTIFSELEKRYGECNVYPIDFYDDNVVCYVYYEQTSESKLTRVYFSIDENGLVTLGEAEEVRVVYEKVEKPAEETNMVTNAECNPEDKEDKDDEDDPEDMKCGDKKPEDAKCGDDEEKKPEDMKCGDDNEKKPEPEDMKCGEDDEKKPEPEDMKCGEDDDEKSKHTVIENPEQCSNVGINNENEEGAAKNEEITTNSSSFAESERLEFETLKRDKKITLLNSYKEDLPSDIIEDYTSKIDNFNYDELEAELAKIYRKLSVNKAPIRAFVRLPDNTGSNGGEQRLASLVNKYKNKNN